jgi:N-acetylmuramoyl-L-alanine amidase
MNRWLYTVGMLLAVWLAVPGVARAQGLQTIDCIVLDPGHGEQDLGTQGPDGVLEKDLTLALAQQLRDLLLERYPDIEVILTREADVYPTLEERTTLANQAGADLFISLHLNAAPNLQAHGIETFYLAPEGTAPGEPAPGRDSDAPQLVQAPIGVMGELPLLIQDDLARVGAMRDSAVFADLMQTQLIAATDALDRGVRTGQFRVLRGARMPAVVVELGFLSHAEEGARLLTADYQALLLDGVLSAVDAWDVRSQDVASQWMLHADRLALGDTTR